MSKGFTQLSAPLAAVAVGRAKGVSSRVGAGKAVKVGRGVGLGISVGGIAVAVGMANCVMATIVHAEDTAVPSTSAGANVGVPCGPQAARKIVNTSIKGKTFLNIFISILMFHINDLYLILINNDL